MILTSPERMAAVVRIGEDPNVGRDAANQLDELCKVIDYPTLPVWLADVDGKPDEDIRFRYGHRLGNLACILRDSAGGRR